MTYTLASAAYDGRFSYYAVSDDIEIGFDTKGEALEFIAQANDTNIMEAEVGQYQYTLCAVDGGHVVKRSRPYGGSPIVVYSARSGDTLALATEAFEEFTK